MRQGFPDQRLRLHSVQELNNCQKLITLDELHKDNGVWVLVSLEKLHEEWTG